MKRITPQAGRVLLTANIIAAELGDSYIAAHHLLMAIARINHGISGLILRQLGVTESIILATLEPVNPPTGCPSSVPPTKPAPQSPRLLASELLAMLLPQPIAADEFDELRRSLETCLQTRGAETAPPSPQEAWASHPFVASEELPPLPGNSVRVSREHLFEEGRHEARWPAPPAPEKSTGSPVRDQSSAEPARRGIPDKADLERAFLRISDAAKEGWQAVPPTPPRYVMEHGTAKLAEPLISDGFILQVIALLLNLR